MALTHTAIKNAKKKPKQYRLSDSGNLYLLVRPNGSKLWRLDYSILGKRKTMALGSYPVIDLKTARAKRDEAKNLLSEGVDPVRHRQLTVSKQKEAVENSFQRISMEWFSRQEKSWSKGHARTVTGRLELNLLPWLGQRPISEISPQELLKVLRKIEARGAVLVKHFHRLITVRDLITHRGDVHHLFPRNYLKGFGLTRGKYNQIANYVMMQSEINITIKDKAPEVYFSELQEQYQTGQTVYGAITSLDDMQENYSMHCIPSGMESKIIDHYENFLLERRKLMALKIRDYYQKL